MKQETTFFHSVTQWIFDILRDKKKLFLYHIDDEILIKSAKTFSQIFLFRMSMNDSLFMCYLVSNFLYWAKILISLFQFIFNKSFHYKTYKIIFINFNLILNVFLATQFFLIQSKSLFSEKICHKLEKEWKWKVTRNFWNYKNVKKLNFNEIEILFWILNAIGASVLWYLII